MRQAVDPIMLRDQVRATQARSVALAEEYRRLAARTRATLLLIECRRARHRPRTVPLAGRRPPVVLRHRVVAVRRAAGRSRGVRRARAGPRSSPRRAAGPRPRPLRRVGG